MVRFIDSHAHLADLKFENDLTEVISRSQEAGADSVICIGASLEQAGASQKIAARFPQFIRFTAGIHPHDAADFDIVAGMPRLRSFFEKEENELLSPLDAGEPDNGLSAKPSMSESHTDISVPLAIAVGECGLDYHYDHSPRDIQRRVFAMQLALAQEFSRPVVVHTREAEADTLAMVTEAGRAGIKGVLHCFTGSMKLAQAAVEVGWYISFSGIITFKKWDGAEIAKSLPEDRILVESDSPYLAPVPYRGKRNEPSWVLNTLTRLAEIRGIEVEKLAPVILKNTNRLFS